MPSYPVVLLVRLAPAHWAEPRGSVSRVCRAWPSFPWPNPFPPPPPPRGLSALYAVSPALRRSTLSMWCISAVKRALAYPVVTACVPTSISQPTRGSKPVWAQMSRVLSRLAELSLAESLSSTASAAWLSALFGSFSGSLRIGPHFPSSFCSSVRDVLAYFPTPDVVCAADHCGSPSPRSDVFPCMPRGRQTSQGPSCNISLRCRRSIAFRTSRTPSRSAPSIAFCTSFRGSIPCLHVPLSTSPPTPRYEECAAV